MTNGDDDLFNRTILHVLLWYKLQNFHARRRNDGTSRGMWGKEDPL